MPTIITQKQLTQLLKQALHQKHFEQPYWHADVNVEYQEKKVSSEYYDREAYERAVERDRLSDRMYPEDIRLEQFKCYKTDTILVKVVDQHYTLDLARLLQDNNFSAYMLEREYPDFPNHMVTKTNDKETCTTHLSIDASHCENLFELIEGSWIESQSCTQQLVGDMQEITQAGSYPVTSEVYRKCLELLPLDEQQIEALYTASRYNGEYRQAIEELHPQIPQQVNRARDLLSIHQLIQNKDSYLQNRRKGQRFTPLNNTLWNQRKDIQLRRLLESNDMTEESMRAQFQNQA